MIRYILFFISLICFSTLSAQNIPEVKLKDNKTLKLSELHVKVNITGNVALTTYNMKFFNSTNRILEGELAFPLGQGQSVTDFAMDVNGKLRHAVIVEKELGRVAYENTIRQTIDPGLLEMTKGNNYKARVYPIPPKGYKELEITYEQVLIVNNKKHNYLLPLQFTKSLSKFSLEIVVHDKKNAHLIENKHYKSLKFLSKKGSRIAFFKDENFIPKESITITMPLENGQSVTTYNSYFNFYKSFEPKKKLKTKPKTVTMFWDASYSMQFRNIKKEMALLEKYFNHLKDVKINLVVFNMKVKQEKAFEIIKGDWSKLKKELESVIYDGGTSFKNLNQYKSEEYMFFTDGMFNLGDFDIDNNTSIYTINAVTSANHDRLTQIATQSGANYINLTNQSIDSAFKTITHEVYQFLGFAKNTNAYEVYPLKNTNVNEDFSLSGKFKNNTVLELLFGFNNKVSDTIKIDVKKGVNNPLVKRLWAKEKLNNLNTNSEENKNKIIRLAKKNHLITSYTSMIILDRIEDYVRYKIEPPSELKSEYKELVKAEEIREQSRLADIKSRKDDLYDDYIDLFDWYNTDFSKLVKEKTVLNKPVNNVERENNSQVTTNNNSGETQTTENISATSEINSRRTLDTSKRIVSGNVSDTNGSPIPGVNIYVKTGNKGAVTDFDGNYSINAEEEEVLAFSYIGFISKEVVLNSNKNINIKLTEDQSQLDEVVVVGYGTQKRMDVTGSVATVKLESVENALNNSMISSLQGRVSGVKTQNSSGQPGARPSITIRGLNSLSNSSEPLYIVDGELYSDKEYKSIATEAINSIRVLKNGEGSSIYGSRASNGIILITTKDGLNINKEKIEELNNKINKEIEFKPWSPNADYLVDLAKSENTDEAYLKYLNLRKTHKNTPTFFMDVAEYFDSINEKGLSLQIVTNLIEIELDNHELIRALAYKLEYFKEYDLAVYVFEEVLKLRPEEPHSHRDLALVYEEIGEYQKSFDLLYKIIDGNLLEKDEEERFYGIEHIAYVEACHLASKYESELNLSEIQKRLLKEFKVDIRVVIDWNHDNTDLDLWVENPNSEKVLFSNKSSKDGGRISEDLMEGYGPEEFMIKKASKGDYEILVDFYGHEVQKISGPTTLKVTIFTNYGQKNETKEVRILRLDKEEDEIEVGTVRI
ncbi:VIT domain-containing protein [Thalassobellus sediminis]|uniref:VIT domain-containing protein n=1 Tax=Thalassobellus sediminis TaxID=3367753 RepID=UPI00379F5C61